VKSFWWPFSMALMVQQFPLLTWQPLAPPI
jgi:hypothetical protein